MSAINLFVKQGLESKILPENHQLKTVITRKLSSPLISILSPPNPPELQYAALRNVNILVQSYPKIFGNEINVFFAVTMIRSTSNWRNLKLLAGLLMTRVSIESLRNFANMPRMLTGKL